MRRMNTLSIVLSLVSLAFAAGAQAQSKTFKVDPATSSVQFVSDAPLERFTGKSTALSGDLTTDPKKIDKTKADIKLDAASFKTNDDTRDRHLREEAWLDAAKYPHVQVVINKVTGASALKPNDLTEVTVAGKLTLHGVTRDFSAPAKIRFTPGASPKLRVVCSFTVNLESHKIEKMVAVKLKVASDIVVNVDLTAVAPS
jgi:polyisoprenoid-binding protein YceI